jgi:dihydroneopterin aldolase
MNSSNKIFIRELKLKMNVGILPQEQGRKTPVIVNAVIELDPKRRWGRDKIEETVSYADIADIVKKVSALQHYNLLEVFLETVADELLADKKIIAVELSAEKPRIIKDTESAGVRISRVK